MDTLQKLKLYLNESREVDNFIKEINKLRNSNKNKWYTWTGSVDGKEIKIKGYGTWLQVYTVEGIDYSGNQDIKVKEFRSVLAEPF